MTTFANPSGPSNTLRIKAPRAYSENPEPASAHEIERRRFYRRLWRWGIVFWLILWLFSILFHHQVDLKLNGCWPVGGSRSSFSQAAHQVAVGNRNDRSGFQFSVPRQSQGNGVLIAKLRRDVANAHGAMWRRFATAMPGKIRGIGMADTIRRHGLQRPAPWMRSLGVAKLWRKATEAVV